MDRNLCFSNKHSQAAELQAEGAVPALPGTAAPGETALLVSSGGSLRQQQGVLGQLCYVVFASPLL